MRIGEAVERVSDSWWPIPSAGTLIAVALTATLLSLDNVVQPAPAIAFRGEAGEARAAAVDDHVGDGFPGRCDAPHGNSRTCAARVTIT